MKQVLPDATCPRANLWMMRTPPPPHAQPPASTSHGDARSSSEADCFNSRMPRGGGHVASTWAVTVPQPLGDPPPMEEGNSPSSRSKTTRPLSSLEHVRPFEWEIIWPKMMLLSVSVSVFVLFPIKIDSRRGLLSMWQLRRTSGMRSGMASM